ncbi:MAG: arginase [Candidatus Polarisedimenticolaceae bacterium]|nr:arginase [Candidatus Polarisedimenticolaceae bacterium]
MRTIQAIGAASCIAGNRFGCCGGPMALRRAGLIGVLARHHGLYLQWQQVLEPNPKHPTEVALARLFRHIRRQIQSSVTNGHPFIFMGGDHSCAMGVWGGVLKALKRRKNFGLIWIDAHMDAHTFTTSRSSNIHGMPIAALLGQADQRLAAIYGDTPSLDPSRLVLIGVRSYEPAEERLLRSLGVQVYTMERIRQVGSLPLLMRQVLQRMRQRCDHYGLSIDLDGIDPRDAPGVGTPVAGGLSGIALCRALKGLGADPALIGMEIAEFNPLQDRHHRTARLVEKLVGSIYGDRWQPPK